MRLLVGALAVALGAGVSFAEGGVRVAVLRGRGDCDKDFDGAFAACGIAPERFACSAEGMKDFAAKIDGFDLVMVVPLFNYAGAKNILGMISSCVDGKVDVGRIDVFTRYCLFDVANENALDVIRELSTLKMKGRAIRVDLATEEQIKRGNKKNRKKEKE